MTPFDSLDTALADLSSSPPADRRGLAKPQVSEGRVTGGVVVIVKRRRPGRSETPPHPDAGQGASAAPSKAPRVFRLATADADEDSPAPAESAVRRKRPRNPVRAPGKVTSIVFPASSARQPASPGAERPANPFMGAADSEKYARLMSDLEAVQEILDMASRAREFRVV